MRGAEVDGGAPDSRNGAVARQTAIMSQQEACYAGHIIFPLNYVLVLPSGPVKGAVLITSNLVGRGASTISNLSPRPPGHRFR